MNIDDRRRFVQSVLAEQIEKLKRFSPNEVRIIRHFEGPLARKLARCSTQGELWRFARVCSSRSNNNTPLNVHRAWASLWYAVYDSAPENVA